MYFSLSFLILYTTVNAESFLNMDVGYYGTPCVLGNLEGERVNNRCFNLVVSSVDILLQRVRPEDYARDILLSRRDHTDPIRLDRSGAHAPQEWRQYTDFLGAGFGSDFANLVGSFFLIPQYVSDGDLRFDGIVTPDDPAAFCYDNQLVMTTVNEGRLEIEVSLINVVTDDPVELLFANGRQEFSTIENYQIETSEFARVPNRIWDVLVQAMREHEIGQRSAQEFETGCESVIPMMPTIQFRLRNNGAGVMDIRMTGSDYLSVNPANGRCRINITWEDDPENYSIGMLLFERVGVLFDYRNNQLGFCDPI